MRQKGIAHLFLLIIVIVVAIGAVGYLAYQNAHDKKEQSSTTTTTGVTDAIVGVDHNWATYINPLVPVTFKYPPNLEVKENVNPESSDKWILVFTDKDEKYTISVSSYEDTFEANKAQIQEQLEEFSNTKLEEVAINGHNSLQYFVPPQEGYVIHQFREYYNYITIIDFNGVIISFQYYSKAQDNIEDYMTLLKTVISQEHVKDWVTYSNSEYEFTIDYPASWTVSEARNTLSFAEIGKVDSKLNISIKLTESPISSSQLNDFVYQNFNVDASNAETVHIQSYPTLRIKNSSGQQVFVTTGKAVLYLESTDTLSNYTLGTLSFTNPANVDVLMR